MPGQPTHRGPAPQDDRLFGAGQLPALRAAAAELCWLLDRGYAPRSALELVGNRHSLTARQRMALARCACSRQEAMRRRRLRVEPARLAGQELWLDGYNVLTILESALAGAIVLECRDGCCRDIAGVHRRYRKVHETHPALCLIGETASAWGVTGCHWWLDKPVSNSGRLKALILDVAADCGWNMQVELTFSPDHVLANTEQVIATSDGVVLDRCRRWVNLAAWIVAARIPQTRLVNLSPKEGGKAGGGNTFQESVETGRSGGE
ncbi:MAG: DUF434 domain-containing protein [Verrucomicrobiota bacterium]|nr:DUF434 domain-containing protein [Verrucomicrobiota bacterium]